MSTGSGTRQEYIAHRGARREFPENTLTAFARALELGADGIELDVHCSRDGVVFIHHDHDVRVGADPASTRPLVELAARELADINVEGEPIPTLDSALELIGHRAVAYVELKGSGIESEVITSLRRHRVECAVHSFDHGAIERAAAIAPEIPRGLLFNEGLEFMERAMASSAARDAWPRWDLIDEPLVARARAIGVRVIAWTVNEPEAARSLLDSGVDGICGDDLRLFPRRAPGR